MEVIPSVRPTFYFTTVDLEILEERVLRLSRDEDTWLYKAEESPNNQCFLHEHHSSVPFSPTNSCSVDSRTFTRRKNCALRPSLETVVESPFSNCSSLGLLTDSRLLNDTFLTHYRTPAQIAIAHLGNYSSNFIDFEEKLKSQLPHQWGNYTFERNRLDSQSSDVSELVSLENCSPFEKNTGMTDSLVHFLEKQDDISYPLPSETENIPPAQYNQTVCAEPTKDDVCINEISKPSKTFIIESDKETSDVIERVLFTNSLNILKQYHPAHNKGEVNTTFTKNHSRQGLNTTFTKSSEEVNGEMDGTQCQTCKKDDLNTSMKMASQDRLNATFTLTTNGLNEAIDDDQTSSASDSSFSSTEKPRSISELRSIAQQQESNLVLQTSTPSSDRMSPLRHGHMDIRLSPIRRPRMSLERSRPSESRSANGSPVRATQPKPHDAHPSFRLQQSMQAHSMSNIPRTLASGLRLPQPVKRFNPQQAYGMRPSSVPAPASTAIPRPQASRLPTLRFRPSSIPGPKRGGGR